MSIIQEALKKAQGDYTVNDSVPRTESAKGSAPVVTVEAPGKNAATKNMAVIVYIVTLLALVTAFGIRALFSKVAGVDKENGAGRSVAAEDKKSFNKTALLPLPAASVGLITEKSASLASFGRVNQPADLTLNGIMYVAERPKAIINGTVVTEGDVISGATVISIGEDKVMLKYNNNENKVEVALKLKE